MGVAFGSGPRSPQAAFSFALAFAPCFAFWPGNGVISLWIKRTEAIKLAELERNTTHKAMKQAAEKRLNQQPALPVGDQPGTATEGNSDDNTR